MVGFPAAQHCDRKESKRFLGRGGGPRAADKMRHEALSRCLQGIPFKGNKLSMEQRVKKTELIAGDAPNKVKNWHQTTDGESLQRETVEGQKK